MKRRILVYSGFGVNATCLQHTIAMCENYNDFCVDTIDYRGIKNTSWELDTSLFIMPGGLDLPYVKRLKGECNNKIKQFVVNGGSYLGICAGAYYASKTIEFAKGDLTLEVIGTRELDFFNGTAIGPVYPGFNYNSNKGAINVEIIDLMNNNNLQAYFHGGCTFKNIPDNIKTIANYKNLEQPAIISGKYGAGNFILSGVHFEYAPELLDYSDKYLQPIIPELEKTNGDRLTMVDNLINMLVFYK